MIAPIIGYKHKAYPEGSVTQFFGESPDLYQSMGMIGHNGIDIVAPWGTPIRAVEGGKICDVKVSPNGYGMHVRIISDTGNEWTYGHLSKIYDFVKIGEQIEEGQFFCLMGNTGFVVSGSTPFWKHNPFSGTHLHLTKREFTYSTKGWTYYPGDNIWIKNYDNGYKGSTNFSIPDDDQTTTKGVLLTAIGLARLLLALLKRK